MLEAKEDPNEERGQEVMHTILICDDDRDIVSALDIYLASEGYRTLKAYNGLEAIQAVERNEVHLILMDIMMPVMDGLEASKKIRELPEGKGKDIPIIAMTANAFVEDKEKTKEAGMNAHLTKPVNREEIIRVLAAYWKNKG